MQLSGDQEDKVEIISNEDGPPSHNEFKDSENSIVVTEKNVEPNLDEEKDKDEEYIPPTERQILLSPDSRPVNIGLTEIEHNSPIKLENVLSPQRNYNDDLKHFEIAQLAEYRPHKDQAIIDSENKIEEVNTLLKEEKFDKYALKLEEQAEPHTLLVGAIDPEILVNEERKVKEKKLLKLQNDAEEYEKKRLNLMLSTEQGKVSLYGEHITVSEKLEKLEEESIRRIFEQRQLVSLTYKKAESTLQHTIATKDGELYTDYSGLKNIKKITKDVDITNNARMREYTTYWVRAPQPLLIHIHLLRAIKDKIATGIEFQYTVLVSVLDRIGGNVMEYQRTSYNQKLHIKRLTKNKKFKCSFDSTELRIEDNLKIVAPCREDMRCSMVLLFELFRINTKESKLETVDGWGVFPLINAKYEINEGKYKIPILTGPVDKSIDQFRVLERKITNNLDKWLCNMYFEVTKIGNAYTRFCIELNLKVHYKIEWHYQRK